MSFNNKSLQTPSIQEAIFIANLLDKSGQFKDASLLDEFVKQSVYNNDMVKQAGLWSGIWNRLSGVTKRVFFKEYRELYKRAKEAHKLISDRYKNLDEQFTLATSQIKNYNLTEWRETVLKMPLKTNDLMSDYEKAFGALVAFTFNLQDKGDLDISEEEEFDISKITPPGQKPETKEDKEVMETSPKKEFSKDTDFFKEKGWKWIDPAIKSIGVNIDLNKVSINKEKFDKMKKVHIVDVVNPENKDLVRLNEHERLLPKGLKEALGNSIWEIIGNDVDWVYLKKVKGEERQITPQESVVDIPDPSLPSQLKLPFDKDVGTTELKKEEPGQKQVEIKKQEVGATPVEQPKVETKPEVKPDVAQDKPKIEPENKPALQTEMGASELQNVVEERKSGPIFNRDEELYKKMLDKNKGKMWISYSIGKGVGKFRLIDAKELKKGQTPVVDSKLIDKLNDAYFLENYSRGRRVEVIREDEVSRAKLVNQFLFKIA